MNEWRAGDEVQITDPKSVYYLQKGVIERRGKTGGLWVKQENGEVVYHPWGYDIVRRGDNQ